MLTEQQIRAAKPQEKPVKLFDEKGLFLLVQPSGARWWRFKYRYGGKEKLLGFGVYPEVSLKDARGKRDAARQLLAAGTDPSAERKAEKVSQAITFKDVALEWLELQGKVQPQSGKAPLASITIEKNRWLFDEFLFPTLGSTPVGEVQAPALLAACRKPEDRGLHETAHRAKQLAGRVLRYAIATGRATRDCSHDIKGALAPVITTHHASITEPARVGELLRAIDGYDGQPSTAAALKLLPLVFVRSNELRGAEWSEIDLHVAEWRIPAERMKMKLPHIVPLSRQAVRILRELKLLTGRGRLVFPGLRTPDRPISENTLNAGLRRLGYSNEDQTAHGFRSIASTLLNEQDFDNDWIETQLAHVDDTVRGDYNYAKYLSQRKQMMQAWADYLDGLKAPRKEEVQAA